ncbi:RDD family protein [Permianibacter sp. IMCC34836]|uniref:RDD family protein n=1 Tax=Permianibacter fluminis TaxID=2738515 RepID=UPI0015526170|nr:RDD family protein [Permianibacter fluminis]NQD38553.1 RDD family protein [Permianibacter fluminis]
MSESKPPVTTVVPSVSRSDLAPVTAPPPSPPPPDASFPEDPRQRVTPHAFLIAPHLLGKPLATPKARAWAIAIDFVLVALLSQVGSFLLAVALAVLSYQLISKRSQLTPLAQTRAGKLPIVLVALFVGWAFFSGLHLFNDDDEPDRSAEVASAAEELVAANVDADVAANTGADANVAPSQLAAERELSKLRAENKRLKAEATGFSVIETGKKMLDDIGFGFGWAAVYFSLLTAWWKGQTIGKRMLGIRVVQLNGRALSVWDCFNRYGGYAAGFATGLLGFAQVIWDDNRQAIHDKISFTVVVDENRS